MEANVLLIGGTRFLGKAISDAFCAKGYNVYTMNRGSRPAPEGIVEQISCDKADRKAFTEVLRRRPWDVVVDTILTSEDLNFVVDTIGNDIGHFIHTGSLGVYGEARRIPAVETMPLYEYQGEEVVFNYKWEQDRVISRAFTEHGFPGTVLRMSYIYGAGDVPLDGWGGRSREFFCMLRDGKRIPLADNGLALLHPGHVEDLGRSFLHAAEHSASIGQVYNIGGAYALMMRDYVKLLAKAMGTTVDVEFVSQQELLDRYPKVSARGLKFACQHMCASIEKARIELNWQPEISLECGLRQNIEWLRQEGIV